MKSCGAWLADHADEIDNGGAMSTTTKEER